MMEEKKFIIGKPHLVSTDYGTTRLVTSVNEAGEIFETFFEVAEEYAPFFSTDRNDFLLYAFLPIAIREGYDILSEAPITEQLLHNIKEVLLPSLKIGDYRVKDIQIDCETIEDISTEQIKGVGTGISCGVDSLYTVKKYTECNYESMRLTHLFLGPLNSELWNISENDNLKTWREREYASISRCEKVAEETGLKMVEVFTNILPYICKKRTFPTRHVELHHYITLATVLSLRYLWRTYYFSSTYDYSHFDLKDSLSEDTAHHELLSMHILGLNSFSCYSVGAEVDRIEKTRILADYDIAQKYLHPCNCKGLVNCSKPNCSSFKCLRALLTFDYYEKLCAMKRVFDVGKYQKNRAVYLWWLCRNRQDPFFEKLYNMMLEKYPTEIKHIEKNNARIDIQIYGADESFNLVIEDHDEMVQVTVPKWFQNGGKGIVIVTNKGELSFKLENKSKFRYAIWLRAPYDKNIMRRVHYTQLNINQAEYLNDTFEATHDAPYRVSLDASNGNEIVNIKWNIAREESM